MAKKTTSTRSKSNTTRRTATGAQQYDRDVSAGGASSTTNRRITNAMERDAANMTRAEFREKYGASRAELFRRLQAADNARSAENTRRITGDNNNHTARMYDDFERQWDGLAREARSRGYAKGGMVKANCGASTKPNRKAKK